MAGWLWLGDWGLAELAYAWNTLVYSWTKLVYSWTKLVYSLNKLAHSWNQLVYSWNKLVYSWNKLAAGGWMPWDGWLAGWALHPSPAADVTRRPVLKPRLFKKDLPRKTS